MKNLVKSENNINKYLFYFNNNRIVLINNLII